MDEKVQNIVESLEVLTNDNTVPRNIKLKVAEVIALLKEDNEQDISMRINKALSALDEVSDDVNLQSYTRTQVWNIVSMLEMAQ